MWTTLKTPADWAAYQVDTARSLGLGSEIVSWGRGPLSYPALVCTMLPPRPAGADPVLYSAYVYMADADELYKTAGRKVVEPDKPVSPTQRQFNRWITAMIMALVKNDIKTGLFAPKGGEEANKDAFEHMLLEEIELVDEYHSAKKDELRKQLAKYETTVLDTLEPPG